MDFLDPQNVAGQSLLQLVARGSSIITELFRLSTHIPQEFYGPFHPNQIFVKKYENILFDFRYLKASESYDERIDSSENNIDLDESLRETYFPLLERFFHLFESFTKYIDNLNTWLQDLEDGAFIQHTLEHIFDDDQGTQLLCEALNVYGLILLLLDLRIPGPIRERLIIAYYRYKGPHLIHTMEQVTLVCRDTGFIAHYYPFLATWEQQQRQNTTTYTPEQQAMSFTISNLPSHISPQRPTNYPEQYFARIPLPQEYLELVINKLRHQDLYFHVSSFPAEKHRTIALSEQASMLYVCLYFQPDILKKNAAICREIVDKFFVDNFIIHLPSGILPDITTEWLPYPCMAQAMSTSLTKKVILDKLTFHAQQIPQLIEENENLLIEGVLTTDFVLDNYKKILQLLRHNNSTLRWSIIHLHATNNVKLRREMVKLLDPHLILQLILLSASLESQMKTICEDILNSKAQRWNILRQQASEYTLELSEVFSGVKVLSRIKKNNALHQWFVAMMTEITNLEYDVSNIIAGRTISQLLHAFTRVKENHQVEKNLQVIQGVQETQECLTEMLRLSNVTPKVLADIDTITDFSYAQRVITLYTPLIHKKIAQSPSLCLMLRAVFQKLSCVLNNPLVRVLQAQSKDSVSVAEYYSHELVQYVSSVLDVVPATVFRLLGSISELLNTLGSEKMPLKIERHHLQNIHHSNERYALSRYTNNISVFTRGVLGMSSTLLGIIQLDPRELLENGIRQHLVLQLTQTFDSQLTFLTTNNRTPTLLQFEQRLIDVSHKITGLRISLQYAQDFLSLFGLKIWNEESSRIVRFYVEQERNRFLKRQIPSYQSSYQNDTVTIPLLTTDVTIQPSSKITQLTDNFGLYRDMTVSTTFIGRVVNELITYSVPTHFIYSPTQMGWFGNGFSAQAPNDSPSLNLRTFALLHQGLGVYGLAGLDNLFAFMIVKDLNLFFDKYAKMTSTIHQTTSTSTSTQSLYPFLHSFHTALTPSNQLPQQGMALYDQAIKQTERLWLYDGLLQRIIKIGQFQLFRQHFQQELHFHAKSSSPTLFNALHALNDALMNDLHQHYVDQDQHNYPNNPLLPEMTQYVDLIGKTNPLSSIYVTTQQSTLHYISLSLFLLVVNALSRMQWNENYATLTASDKKAARDLHLDGVPLIAGVITVLKQLHVSHTHLFLQHLGQYISTVVNHASDNNIASSGQHIIATTHTQTSEFAKITNALTKIQAKQIAAEPSIQQTNGRLIHSNYIYIPLLPIEATRTLVFLELFSEFTELPREGVTSVLSPYLLDSAVRV